MAITTTPIASLPSIASVPLNAVFIIQIDGVATYQGTAQQILDAIVANVNYLASSDVNVVNGIAGLDGSGLINASQLPFSATSYLGVYNTLTNSPTLADVTGLSGQFVFVGTAGTRNFGSGNIITSVGNILVHNGTVWQLVAFVATGVSTWNSLTGNINATTANLPDSPGFRYTSDNVRDASVGNGGLPSLTNTYVTEHGLSASIITAITTPLAAALAAAANALSVAQAAIPLSQKAAALGVATLDASGKVPPAQLPTLPNSYVGTYNATTNIPAIVNGTGSVGQIYIVSTAGTQNFGAGSLTFAIGDEIVCSAGIIWQKVPSTASGVVSVNGFTNVVSIGTNDVPVTGTNKNYETDSHKAALTNSLVPLTALNAVVSETELTNKLTGASPVFVKQFNTFQMYGVPGFTVGNGTGETLAALGLTSGQAATFFPKSFNRWGTLATSLTHDSCAVSEGFLTMGTEKYNQIQSEDNKQYRINHQINIPNGKVAPAANTDSYSYRASWAYNSVIDQRVGAGSLFDKSPANESDAANIDVESQWIMENGRVVGNMNAGVPTAGSIGFRIGASKGFEMNRMKIYGYDKGFVGSLLLRSTFFDNEFGNCTTSGLETGIGWWSGASFNGDVSQSYLLKNRFFSIAGIGANMGGQDTLELRGNQFEGTGGTYGVYVNNAASSVMKYVSIFNSRFENQSKWSGALIGFAATDTFAFEIDKVFNQAVTTGTILLESHALNAAEVRVSLRRCYNSGGASAFKLYNIQQMGDGSTDFDIAQSTFTGQPEKTADFLVDNNAIWHQGANYAIPGTNRIYFTQRLPKVSGTSFLY